MYLGAGSFLCISCCILDKYDSTLIKALVYKIQDWDSNIVDSSYRCIHPDIVNYENMMDGVNTIEKKGLIEDDLNKYVLWEIGFILQKNIATRLFVSFLDKRSYEICLLFNYSDLIEFETDKKALHKISKLIEKKAFDMFEIVKPLMVILLLPLKSIPVPVPLPIS